MADGNERSVIDRLSGHGKVTTSTDEHARDLGEGHYDLIVTGNVVVGSAAGDPDPGREDVSGTIAVVDSDADLMAMDTTLVLWMEEDRYLSFVVEEKIPGGFRIQGTSGIEDV